VKMRNRFKMESAVKQSCAVRYISGHLDKVKTGINILDGDT
jgi:hypothetical protein